MRRRSDTTCIHGMEIQQAKMSIALGGDVEYGCEFGGGDKPLRFLQTLHCAFAAWYFQSLQLANRQFSLDICSIRCYFLHHRREPLRPLTLLLRLIASSGLSSILSHRSAIITLQPLARIESLFVGGCRSAMALCSAVSM